MMELLPNFNLICPRSVAEAVAVRAAAGEIRFLAGGTDLLAVMRRGLVQAKTLISLSDVVELQGITDESHGVRIGAGTTLEALAENPMVARAFPVVAEAALAIAGPTRRAVGTVGGNLRLDTRCQFYNQSESWRSANNFYKKLGGDSCRVAPKSDHCYATFSGDLAPALMVHCAVVEIAGPNGTRQSPLAEVYSDDGIAYLTLAPGELLVAVRVSIVPGLRSSYQKIRTCGAIDFPLAGVAVALRSEREQMHDLRIATTGADSRPLMIAGVDELCAIPLDEALTRLDKPMRKQVGPMETTLTPATYRRRVMPVMAQRLIQRLLADGRS